MDHVPAKVFFPAAKDLDGVDVRVNLLRVPSCRPHNNWFSRDEEYVAYIATCDLKANDFATRQVSTKVMRAIDRRPQFLSTIFPDLQPVVVDGVRTGAFHIDIDRFETVMRKIVAGLYYAITGYRLPDWSIMQVYSPALRASESFEAPFATLKSTFEQHRWKPVLSGDPRIFKAGYIINEKRLRHFAFRLVFYEGFEVWILSSPRDALWLG